MISLIAAMKISFCYFFPLSSVHLTSEFNSVQLYGTRVFKFVFLFFHVISLFLKLSAIHHMISLIAAMKISFSFFSIVISHF